MRKDSGHESPTRVDGPDSVNERPSPKVKWVATQIRKMLAPLPDGYYVEVDRSTHNILIANPDLGFCVTEHAIKDGIWEAGIRLAFDTLVTETNKLRGVPLTESGANGTNKLS